MKKAIFVIVFLSLSICFAREITKEERDRVCLIGDIHGVPRSVVCQLIYEESRGKVNAKSHVTAEGYYSEGLFQLYTRPDNLEYLLFLFWRQPRECFDIQDPIDNAMVALAYMAYLHDWLGNWYDACIYYNHGSLKNVPQKTKDYARRIVNAR